MSDAIADAEAVLRRIGSMLDGTTHWAGCEADHILCAATVVVRKLIEERDGWRSAHRSAHGAYVRARDRAIAAKLRVAELERHRMTPEERSAASCPHDSQSWSVLREYERRTREDAP